MTENSGWILYKVFVKLGIAYPAKVTLPCATIHAFKAIPQLAQALLQRYTMLGK